MARALLLLGSNGSGSCMAPTAYRRISTTGYTISEGRDSCVNTPPPGDVGVSKRLRSAHRGTASDNARIVTQVLSVKAGLRATWCC